MKNHKSPITILVADDDADDRDMIKEAFDANNIEANLEFFENGQKLMDHLISKCSGPIKELPGIILLDINMPKKSGMEVLAEVRAHPELSCIPVVMLTTSNQHEHILATYKLGANSYITKPATLKEFKNITKAIEVYWLRTVELPMIIYN